METVRGRIDFPKMYWYGEHEECEWEVMQLLGCTLLRHFLESGKKSSFKTVLMVADQLIEAIESLHTQGVLHLDLKPDNIMFGSGPDSDTLYLIDFGLSKLHTVNGTHIPCLQDQQFKGNIVWASVNSMSGETASRRDDLESMMYSLMFLLTGELPWMRLNGQKLDYEKVLRIKETISPAVLFKGVPAFRDVFTYIKTLKFDETPNYDWIRKKFRRLAKFLQISYDSMFDWKQSLEVADDFLALEVFMKQYEIRPREVLSTDAEDSPSHEEVEASESAETVEIQHQKRREYRDESRGGLNRHLKKLDSISSIHSPGSPFEHVHKPLSSDPVSIRPILDVRVPDILEFNLSPVLECDETLRKAADIEDVLDECILETDFPTTPKLPSPVLTPSVRLKYRKLREMTH